MKKIITIITLLLIFSNTYAKTEVCTCAQFYKTERDMVKIQLFYFDSCIKTLSKSGYLIEETTKTCIDAVNAQFNLAAERAKNEK